MSDLLAPVYIITGLAIMQLFIDLTLYRRFNPWVLLVGVAPWGILGALELASRVGWLPEPENTIDPSWFLWFGEFGAFWDLNEKELNE